jgi:NAD(P)-dependent dehydrogenase (short-subunit alcohol dehydrogenase family)
LVRKIVMMVLLGITLQPVYALAEGAQEGNYVPTVLITGSNRGIGFEFTRQYAASGWRVIATARRPDKAEALQALAAGNKNILIEQLDIIDLQAVDALSAKYAQQPLDVLINNAAISGSPSPQQLFGRVDYENFDAFMATNVRGPLKVSEAFLPQLRAGHHKKLVAISSLGGSFYSGKSTATGTMLYRISKAALNMVMVNIAVAVEKHGIVVTMINPGLVDTQGILGKMNEKMKLGLTLTPVEDSVAGMIQVIENASLETSGLFYQFNGQQQQF